MEFSQQSTARKLDPNINPAREGRVTKMVEGATSRVPSVGYLSLAIASILGSAALAFFSPRKELANFVGLWGPTFMLVGIYNKLVKLEGSDRESKNSGKLGFSSH